MKIQKALRVSQGHKSNEQNFLRLDPKTQCLTSDAHPAQESPELRVTFLVHMLPGTGSSLLFKPACFNLGGL